MSRKIKRRKTNIKNLTCGSLSCFIMKPTIYTKNPTKQFYKPSQLLNENQIASLNIKSHFHFQESFSLNERTVSTLHHQ